MRKSFFAACLLALSFASCEKQNIIVNTKFPKPPFRVSRLTDVTVERSPFNYQRDVLAYLYIVVQYEYGEPKRVTLALEDLPAGLKDSFAVRSGYPDFGTQIALYDQGVQSGAYTAKLIAKAEGDSGSISYPFKITISGDTSCAAYFGGKAFTALNSCSANFPNPLVPYVAGSYQLNGTDTVVISNFKNDGTGLKLLLNCRESKVTVPEQTVGGRRIQGHGILAVYAGSTPNVIVVNLTEQDAQGNVVACNYSFEIK